MTKVQAGRFAKRLLLGYIEQEFHGKAGDPLVYDELSPSEVRGKRLSSADEARVEDAMAAITGRFVKDGWTCVESFERDSGRHYRPDGVPGAKWKGFDSWGKRQGRW